MISEAKASIFPTVTKMLAGKKEQVKHVAFVRANIFRFRAKNCAPKLNRADCRLQRGCATAMSGLGSLATAALPIPDHIRTALAGMPVVSFIARLSN